MIPPRLSVVTLGARDLAALRGFYERLGWKTNSTAGDFASFALGGAVLCLYEIAKLAEEAGDAAVPAEAAFKGFTLAVNVDEREQVDEALRSARDAGATVLAEPTDRDWGDRHASATGAPAWLHE